MNKSGEENRSVRNTKKRLREGLLSLMKEKPVNEITVKELTELADVNRGTFYFHYEDIYALLHDMEDEFFAEFSLAMDSIPSAETARAYLLSVFTIVGEHSELCRILLGQNGDMQFIAKIYQFIDEKCSSIWSENLNLRKGRPLELYNSFIINGCIGMVKHWLESGMQETPDEVTDLAVASIIASARAYIL